MPTHLAGRAPRVFAATGAASFALALAGAAPGMARPAGQPPLPAPSAAQTPPGTVPTGSLAGTTSPVDAPGADVAAPDQQSRIAPLAPVAAAERPRVTADDGGATTLAVVAIAAAALLAGLAAGFAGGRRFALGTG
jgi:hypothetical protein